MRTEVPTDGPVRKAAELITRLPFRREYFVPLNKSDSDASVGKHAPRGRYQQTLTAVEVESRRGVWAWMDAPRDLSDIGRGVRPGD